MRMRRTWGQEKFTYAEPPRVSVRWDAVWRALGHMACSVLECSVEE